MTGSGPPDQGEGPHTRQTGGTKTAGPPVLHPFGPKFHAFAAAALVCTIILFVVIAARSGVAGAIAAALASLAALAAALASFFQAPKLNVSAFSPNLLRSLVASVLVADLLAGAGWLAWSVYRDNRSVDVLGKVTLQHATGVLPGHESTLLVPITAARNDLVAVFRAADHNSSIGTCAPDTVLTVTTDLGANRSQPVPVTPGHPARISIPPGTTELRLSIAVWNTRHDRNCGVDISVLSAQLQN